MRRLGVGAALVGDELISGDVGVEDDTIVAVGLAGGGSGVAVPGFVDLQVNGFAGFDFGEADVDGVRQAARALVAHGTTAFQPTLITLPVEEYMSAMKRLRRASEERLPARILGVHVEGPFLSPRRFGAHDPSHLRPVDPGLYQQLAELGPLTYVTLAPELPGALDLIPRLIEMGVVVAIGHSDADAATAHAAFNAGARAVTHLFNAQRPVHHRDPGITFAALARRDVVVGVIADGVHLAPDTLKVVVNATLGRIALVTDAVAPAGLGEGEHTLGGQRLVVTGTEVRLEDGTIAGSVLTMDAAVRNLMDAGAPFEKAVACATRIPARLIGRPELGTLAPGTVADVAVLDDSLVVSRALVGGEEVFRA
jgi:N-acetylglucosamine-6-phosphate deacetylase